jgi:hypothetical protein
MPHVLIETAAIRYQTLELGDRPIGADLEPLLLLLHRPHPKTLRPHSPIA